MLRTPAVRRLPALTALLTALALLPAAAASAAAPDVTNLSGAEAEAMLKAGTLTSVELTQAYLDRISKLNKSGPALNAVTQLNAEALQDAADSDRLRAAGTDLGPAMGLPILLKDIVDAKGQYTSAGNYSLRNSFPEKDSGVSAYLRKNGVIILGKVGLSEFANYFGGQQSGFSNLTGQVLNANDADSTPSGSSSGTGSAVQASLSSLGIGTETSGSIISPSQAEGIVGLRPTVGLVPGYGIAPIIASQDTAGPMERTVTDAAMTLQSITGTDPAIEAEAKQEYVDVFGADYVEKGILPARPASIPDYMSALKTDFAKGKRIGYTFDTPDCGGTAPTAANDIAYCALEAAGATLLPVANSTGISYPGISNVEAHVTIDGYYKHLGPNAPVKSMADETAANNSEPILALKFNNATHWNVFQSDISAAPLAANRATLATAKQAIHAAFDNVFSRGTASTADDLVGVIGTLSNAPQAGYPQITVPMGYSASQRRAINTSVFGPAFSERDLIGIGYALEQATKLRQNPEQLNPSMYRCAKTTPAPAFAARGACNPDYDTASAAAGTTETPDLGFKLEDVSVTQLQQWMVAGTLTSVALTKAYLNRIALTNAQGPGLQAVRALSSTALAQAKAADDARAGGRTGAMLGIPVLLDDSYDVAGMTTTAGSIALQDNTVTTDSAVVTRLKAAGAVILGKTNVSEFNGVFDQNLTAGYSSLGGQVLHSYDTDRAPGGSSAGAASALSSGLAAVTIGLQSSQNGLTTAGANDPTLATASAILPASVMGVAALKPTVGRTSRLGVLGAAKSQDSPTPMATTITGLAQAMNAVAGTDAADPQKVATGATPADYAAGLSASLAGKTINVLPTAATTDAFVATNTPGYNDAITALQAAGGTAVTKTISSLAANQPATPASTLAREFRRDLNAYLTSAGHSGGVRSLTSVVNTLVNRRTEGLKYSTTGPIGTGTNTCNTTTRQLPSQLCNALNAADITGQSTSPDVVAFNSDLATSRTNYQAYLTTQLQGADALLVPATSPLVGYADRAGYPVLEMQSGYQFTGTAANGYQATHDPFGVVLIGAANAEQTLLNDAFAIEQKLQTQTVRTIPLGTPAEVIAPSTTPGQYVYSDAHVAPSVYNPAMFRCIPGSVYYAPYNCHPGEVGYVSPVKAPVTPPTTGPTTTPGGATPTDTTTTTTPAAVPPAPAAPAPAAVPGPAGPAPLSAQALDVLQATAQKKALAPRIGSSTKTYLFKDTFATYGSVVYTLRLSIPKAKGRPARTATIGSTRLAILKPGTYSVRIAIPKAARVLLGKYKRSKVVLVTEFRSTPTKKAITTTRTIKRR